MIKIRVPATSANLGAGFDALGLALGFYNYVEMEESDHIDITSADGIEVPADETNMIYVAARDLYEICGKKLEGLKIIQTNNIPMARGLGSSSACIVAGLAGANHLLGNPLTQDDLVDLAAQIEGHPDNTAPALLGGIVTAVFDGRKVHWVKQEVYTKLHFEAMIPEFELKRQERVCRRKFRIRTQSIIFQERRFSRLRFLQENMKICVLPYTTSSISRTEWNLFRTAVTCLTQLTLTVPTQYIFPVQVLHLWR